MRRLLPLLGLVSAGLLLAAPAALAAEVTIGEGGVSPARVQVDVGESVVFTNDSGERVVLGSDDPEFTSGELAPGETFSIEFQEPGRVRYRSDDGDLRGVVVVRREGSRQPAREGSRGGELPATGLPAVGLLVVAAGAAGAGTLLVARSRR